MGRRKKYESFSFEDLAKIIHGYLKEEGLSLNLSGYREVLKRYFHMHDNNLSEIYSLMIDCNLWSNYFAELESFLSLKKEEWMLKIDWLYAHENMAKPSEALENRIQDAKQHVRHYDMFIKHCHAQMNFFKKASEHCYNLYFKGLRGLIRSN